MGDAQELPLHIEVSGSDELHPPARGFVDQKGCSSRSQPATGPASQSGRKPSCPHDNETCIFHSSASASISPRTYPAESSKARVQTGQRAKDTVNSGEMEEELELQKQINDLDEMLQEKMASMAYLEPSLVRSW